DTPSATCVMAPRLGGWLSDGGGSASELGARESDQLRVGVGVPGDAPAPVVRLGEDHPGPLHESGITGGFGNDVGQSSYGDELLVAVEGTGVGEHLDAHSIVLT